MGFKDSLKQAMKDAPAAVYGPFTLTNAGNLKKRGEHDTHPVAGATAHLEQGEAFRQRITATRLVTTGAVGLFWKKKGGGDWWLTVEGDEFFWTEHVDRKDQDKARKFAARVNNAARHATNP